MSSPEANTSDQLAKFDRRAGLLDSQFSGLGCRVGWDPDFGSIPGVGDAVTVVPAAPMFNALHKAGVRGRALGRIALNTRLDVAVATRPLMGCIFDVACKSHKKNSHIQRTEIEPHSAKSAAQT